MDTSVYHMKHLGVQNMIYCEVNQCKECHVAPLLSSVCIKLNHLAWNFLYSKVNHQCKYLVHMSSGTTICHWCASHHATCHAWSYVHSYTKYTRPCNIMALVKFLIWHKYTCSTLIPTWQSKIMRPLQGLYVFTFPTHSKVTLNRLC